MKSTDQNGRSITDVEARLPAEFRDTSLYINRELSWLSFNDRVLEEAQDPSVPLLERLRFLAICSSNLDEFFEVRVAGLQAQLYDNLEPQDSPPDGMGPHQQLTEISKRAHDFVTRQYETWTTQVHPALVEAGIRLCSPTDLLTSETAFLDDYFERLIFPALTPLAIDPAHPFPHLFNKTLNLILRLESESTAVESSRQLFAVLQVPPMLSRVVPLPETEGGGKRFILLRDVILPRLDSLFAGFRVSARSAFRVTRNSDLSIQENEVKSSLLSTVQETLRQRKWGAAVRLEITSTADDSLVSQLRSSLDLEERDVYRVDGPVDLTSLLPLCRVDGFRDLKEPIFEPQTPALLANRANMFALLRDQDLLVHHPYESFDSVIQFIEQAADDPQVLAIKQTLYRTADDNPIITALARAAESGKQVTTLVELQARLDEENNIVKARALQKAGVHVVYGVVGLKTHCKAILVVRREQDGIRRYVHLGTGNYNPTTARIYTDLSYFTSRPEFGEDASALFNHLTGYSHGHKWNRLVIAPYHLASRVVELIDRERKHAEAGHAARIIAKLNALVDPAAIEALYAASRAGVKIDLIVRGICCLRPGIPGISDRIRVTSIIDKFLEHSRVMYFQNNDNPEVYCSSADWMPRNFRRRVELMFPIEDSRLQSRLVDGILGIGLADNVKARLLQPDGTYIRVKPRPGEPLIRSQVEYQKMSREFSPALILSESAEGATEATAKPSPTPERSPKRERSTSPSSGSRKS